MKNILIIRSGGMGDMLFITPAIHILRKNIPSAKLHVLVPSHLASILEGNKDIDKIIENPYHSPLRLRGVIDILKPHKFDLLVTLDPRRNHDYKFLGKALDIRSVWSVVDSNSSAPEYNKYNVKDFIWAVWDTNKHHVENYIHLFKQAGLDIGSTRLNVQINEEDIDFVNNLLRADGLNEKDLLIVLHPGNINSNYSMANVLLGKLGRLLKAKLPIERRRWPLKHYSALANLLHKELKAKIAITGSRHEAGLANRIIRSVNSDNLINLCGKTTIKQLAALYKMSDVVVSSDTGPLHLAAAVDTPVVGIYGYTDPIHSHPWADESRFRIIQSKLKCSPCQHTKRKKICWRAVCMEQIKPQDVLDAVKELMIIPI